MSLAEWIRRHRPRLTLRVRFALLMAVAVASLGLANRAYVEVRFVGELERELEWRALALASHLASIAATPTMVQDLLTLHRLLEDARTTSPDVAYAFVLDPTNRVVAHTFAGSFPSYLAQINRHYDGSGHTVQRIDVLGETFRDFALPIYHGELGTLRLGVRDQRILARLSQVRAELALLLLGVMVVAALGAYALTAAALRPLQGIVAALERFVPGQRREPAPWVRDDEIGDLSRRVNGITSRLHETQRQLVRTERMASIGVMASGLAHEINNPITGIQNCARRLLRDPSDARQTAEYAEIMLQATEHLARVVRGLLDFSRSGGAPTEHADLREVASRALDLSGMRLRRQGITLERDLDRAAVVRGDAAQLTQVVVNLLLNAIDAMPDGGRLAIRLRCTVDQAYLSVADTGPGIPPEDQERIFEPFFTTKPPGKGTGLGLAVSHGIIRDHGGRIEVHTGPGRGTEMTVSLPLIDPSPGGDR